MTPTEQISAELQYAFNYFTNVFEAMLGELPTCIITVQRVRQALGYFSPKRFVSKDGEAAHEIAITPQHLPPNDDTDALSTLLHEMVHLWQENYGQPGRRGYHNREWGSKM